MKSKDQPVELIGVPLDHGAGQRGVSMGPTALRIAGLKSALEKLELKVVDGGDITVPIPDLEKPGDPKARYLETVSETCQKLSSRVHESLQAGRFPLILGGDHSVAVGTISGVSSYYHSKNPGSIPKVGVLWLDAHADLNTPETSPTGNIHGMPLACLLGNGPKSLTDVGYDGVKLEPHRIVQVGLRDLDPGERRKIREHDIRAYTMEDVDRRGLPVVLEEAISHVLADCDHLHVSFDIDVIDPRFAPGTGTAMEGGFTYREAHLAMEMVAETGKMGSLELVEVNPVLDHSNKTAEVGVAIVASALGEEILS